MHIRICKYTTKYLNILSLILAIIIFIIINILGTSLYQKINLIQNQILISNIENQDNLNQTDSEINSENTNDNINNTDNIEENINYENELEIINVENVFTSDLNWYLEIPKISLVATEISEGTTTEVMEYYIGHFEETSKNYRKCSD